MRKQKWLKKFEKFEIIERIQTSQESKNWFLPLILTKPLKSGLISHTTCLIIKKLFPDQGRLCKEYFKEKSAFANLRMEGKENINQSVANI